MSTDLPDDFDIRVIYVEGPNRPREYGYRAFALYRFETVTRRRGLRRRRVTTQEWVQKAKTGPYSSEKLACAFLEKTARLIVAGDS